MRQRGSVLIVVLGLLAILAVIGVAFVTMSSIERSTARSYALSSQMQITADDVVDYVCHDMITDLWEEYEQPGDPRGRRGPFAPGLANLLTGAESTEPYDAPTGADVWMTSPIEGDSPPRQIAYNHVGGSWFDGAIQVGNASPSGVNNFGPPYSSENGVYMPEIVYPFENGVMLASATVIDHGGLINVNVHGNVASGSSWIYQDARGYGYFMGDVQPFPVSNCNTVLVLGDGAGDLPGRWGAASPSVQAPDIPRTGGTLVENRGIDLQADKPFTIDEEFELRLTGGTAFDSRLEEIWSGLKSERATPAQWQNRLNYTTVSWTAQITGDGLSAEHLTSPEGDWSARLVDINLDPAEDIYEVLTRSAAIDASNPTEALKAKQFVANIIGFRRQDHTWDHVTLDGENFYPARRQPFFSEFKVTEQSVTGEDEEKETTYLIEAEVFNPWPGEAYASPNKLDTSEIRVEYTLVDGSRDSITPAGNEAIAAGMDDQEVIQLQDRTLVVKGERDLKDALAEVRMVLRPGSTALPLDWILNGEDSDIAALDDQGRIYRRFAMENETRGGQGGAIRVVYVDDWNPGGNGNLGVADIVGSLPSATPLRFPACVPHSNSEEGDWDAGSRDGPLPVRDDPNDPIGAFKAFARVGDLNQVLRFSVEADGRWSIPWVVYVTKFSQFPRSLKWNWRDTSGTAAAFRASRVLCTGGPWNDGMDNDGDGKVDDDDEGLANAGRRGGPENRVAGLINLNSATLVTLGALEQGLGFPLAANFATTLHGHLQGPTPHALQAPAEILTISPSFQTAFTTNTADAKGLVEREDLVYTRLSNLVTVRSDTFSIYGTVQFKELGREQPLRSRRFWALVDRSASSAYQLWKAEGEANVYGNRNLSDEFHHPRILNFQWLD